MRKIFTVVLIAVCAGSSFVSAWAVLRFRAYERDIIENLQEDLVRRTQMATEQIRGFLEPASVAAEGLAKRLSAGDPTHEEVVEQLREAIESHDSFYGGTVAFEPYRFDPGRRLYAPYFAKKDGEMAFLQIEDEYDYTDAKQVWYGAALAEGSRWSEPYFDESVGDIFMTTYAAVFHEPDGRTPRGVVTVDISMDAIHEVVRSLDLGAMGYAVLVSRAGRFLSHPNEELVLSRVTARELAKQANDAVLLSLTERVLADERGLIEWTSPLTGSAAWYIFEPIPATGWKLVSAFLKDDIPLESTTPRRQLILAVSSAVVFLISAGALGLNVLRGQRRRLWMFSVTTSLILVAGIGCIWALALRYPGEAGGRSSITNDPVSLKAFTDALARRAAQRLVGPLVFLPTGLHVESLRFSSRTAVEMRGFIWQRFDPQVHADLEHGFTLRGVSKLSVGEPITEWADAEKITRWPFETTLRVRFDYTKFPLMEERIRLQIAPRLLSKNIVLVPDLGAYPVLSPAARPGLHRNAFLPGWEITRTFFHFEPRTEATDFGLRSSSAKQNLPALYYSIEIHKNFIDSFVSNLIPLLMVAIVAFLVLMIVSHDQERIGTGLSLSVSGTLLFVVVLSHIGVRQKIATQEIIYLEYFYLVMYLAILWVAVYSILLAAHTNFWLIRHEENLLPRVMFWPGLLGVILTFTLVTFY